LGLFDLAAPVFARFAHRVYPDWARDDLVDFARGLPSGARVLDLGGGTGVLAGWARSARPDLRLVVAEPSAAMRRHVPPGVEALSARAEALPFADAALDAVLIGEALHHFADPGAALAEVARVLRPGGGLWVYEFDPATPGGRVLRVLERLVGEPGHFFTPEDLRRRLLALGIEARHRARGASYVLRGRKT